MTKTETWARLTTPEGQAELRVAGSTWQALVRQGLDTDFRVAATGSLEGGAADPLPPTESFAVRDLYIDPAGRALKLGGRDLHLSRAGFDLVLMLAQHPTRRFTREEIIREVHSGFAAPDSVRTLVYRTRKAFGDDAWRQGRPGGYLVTHKIGTQRATWSLL